MRLFACLIQWAWLASAATIVFKCPRTTGTCENACYAVNHALAPSELHRRSAANDDNRKNSGCNMTPCTNTDYKQYGDTCDEYPFATTDEGGTNATLRCVPSKDNTSQGGQLSAFYKSASIGQGDAYTVGVEDFRNATFCRIATASNDGSEFRLVNGKFRNSPRDARPKRMFQDVPGLDELDVILPSRSQLVLDSKGAEFLVLVSPVDEFDVRSLLGSVAYDAFTEELSIIVRLL